MKIIEDKVKVSETKLTFTGGCYCGEVRYQCEGPQRLKGLCYCRTCQMISGGAGNLFMAVDAHGYRQSRCRACFGLRVFPQVVVERMK